MSERIPRERAEAFAITLRTAIGDATESEHFWEAATRTSGLNGFDVRVIEGDLPRFLIGQDWLVYMDVEWSIREWLGADDPDFDAAVDSWALPDSGIIDEGDDEEDKA